LLVVFPENVRFPQLLSTNEYLAWFIGARGTRRMLRAARRSCPRGFIERCVLVLSLLADGARAAGTCSDGRGGRGACAELRPRTPLFGETAPIDGAPRLYALMGLKPNTAYEVRVSYPATNPADIRLELVGSLGTRRANRKMLNVEKLVLSSRRIRDAMTRTNEERENSVGGNAMETSRSVRVRPIRDRDRDGDGIDLIVRLDARRYGTHRDGPEKGFQNVVYDVAVEPAIDPFGVVPAQSIPVAFVAVACVVIACFVESSLRRMIWPETHDARARGTKRRNQS
jgi:hypothetical protein